MIRIALPNKGRLTEGARELLERAGLEFDTRGDRALQASLGDDFLALFVNARDIPEFVADGAAVLSDRRLPVMGIGVGMQLLNVSEGGNLFLHLPEDVPTALPHRDPQDPAHRHGLMVTPGSLMDRVYGDGGPS